MNLASACKRARNIRMTTKKQGKKKKEAVTFSFSHPHQLVLMINNTPPASPRALSYIYNIIVDTKNTIFYKQSVKPYFEKSKTKLMVTKCPRLEVYVVVNFLSQVVFFLFLLFLGMVINETEKKKNYLRRKIDYNVYITFSTLH